MVLGQYRRAIGVFSRERDVEDALNDLQNAGFPMDRVSVIAKDRNSTIEGKNLQQPSGHEVEKGAKVGSVTGTALGMVAGLLASAATLAIPGVGVVLAAGTVGSTIAATLAGGGVGALSGGLMGALAGLGIPGDKAKVYSDRLSQGDYLLVVEGKSDEIMRAEMILLNNRGIEEWGIYDIGGDEPLTARSR